MFSKKFFILRGKRHFPLTVILVFAAIVRFVGLDYGLPLWLAGDEVSHIFGALKMMELKTLLPVLHPVEFAGIFYYTPYLSYLYLLPFTIVAGIRFLFFSGTFEHFKNYLIADPSVFFIIARSISAVFGLVTVWFVYAVAWQMFQKKKVALFSALFITFSYLPVSYSHWARHWTAITFLYTVGIYILAHRELTISRRYLLIALLIGIGVGVNVQMTIFGILVLIWFFAFDYQPISKLLRQKWLWQAGGIFIVLFELAFIVWPRGYGYLLKVGDIALIDASAKNLADFVNFSGLYISDLIYAEPLLLLFICIGLLFMFFIERRKAFVFISFLFLYLIVFYLFFSHVDRFILPTYPLLVISAGYGIAQIVERLPTKLLRLTLVAVIVILLVSPILRFSYLLVKNDTRVQAIDWVKANIPTGAKVMILAPLMRLPSTVDALAEQQAIDSGSLRSVDKTEMSHPEILGLTSRFHALNLFNVSRQDFFNILDKYLAENNYQYVVFNPSFARQKGALFLIDDLGTLLQSYQGSGDPLTFGCERVPDGFGVGLRELFYSSSLGPEIKIIKLN